MHYVDVSPPLRYYENRNIELTTNKHSALRNKLKLGLSRSAVFLSFLLQVFND